jgi:hypothetical protein
LAAIPARSNRRRGGAYGPPQEIGHQHEPHREATGKIDGVIYNRFGDFEGFCLLTEEGYERAYRSHETEVEALARYAWQERVVVRVVTEPHRPDDPARIILLRAPPQSRHRRT